jgi:hypothetical protein
MTAPPRPFRADSQRSAGGHELQPSEVNSSTTAGGRSALAAWQDAAAAGVERQRAGRQATTILRSRDLMGMDSEDQPCFVARVRPS